MTLAYGHSSSPYRMPASVDEPSRAGALVTTADGRSLPFASATLKVQAGGGIARIVLQQTFENPYEETLRVTYKMPLPIDGAVSGYAFTVGTRTITGKIDRKESARKRFEEALVQGKTAALLDQDKPDIFTQDIGNIPPRQSLIAEITIDQRLAWTTDGEWELRFPTVIGPRYMSASVSAADAKASHVELADGGVRARAHLEVHIADTITDGKTASSPSHRVSTRPDGAIELATLEGAKLDRDIVVRWPVAARAVGLSLHAARPDAGLPISRHGYALLSIVPPAPDAKHASLPRDLIVLLDTSGSMGGRPLEQAQRVVSSLIDSLDDHDRLEVVEFSSSPRHYQASPVPATAKEKKKAVAWVMKLTAGGATEMQSAITEALRGLRPGAQRQVVLVTDGYVGGEQQIVTMLHESMPASCRMHVVGVGSAVNRALAASLARAGRGAEVLIGLDEDAERGARRLVSKTRAPVLTDLVIGGDALVEQVPEHMPDVFEGAPVLAALQVKATGGEIVVRGNLARGTWEERIQVPPTSAGEGNAAIVKLFAREAVADLEMRWSIGKEVQTIDREIESLGMVYQIATRRTSWLAIDEDRTVDPTLGYRHEEVPQELPYGTTMASFGGGMPLAAPMMAMSLSAPARAMSMPMGAMGARRGGGPPPAMRPSVPAPLSRPAAGMPAPPGAAPPPARLGSPTLTGGGGFGAPPREEQKAREDAEDEITEERTAVLFDIVPPAPQTVQKARSAPGKEEAPLAQYSAVQQPAPLTKKRRPTWLVLLAIAMVVLALLAALARFLLS